MNFCVCLRFVDPTKKGTNREKISAITGKSLFYCLIQNPKFFSMSQFDDLLVKYKEELGGTRDVSGVDETLLTAITKSLGPSIYNDDSSRVSCSDKTELDRVKNNFLIGKMGLADGPDLDAALKEVCEQMGTANRNKYRAIFYYLLVKKLGLEAKYA